MGGRVVVRVIANKQSTLAFGATRGKSNGPAAAASESESSEVISS